MDQSGQSYQASLCCYRNVNNSSVYWHYGSSKALRCLQKLFVHYFMKYISSRKPFSPFSRFVASLFLLFTPVPPKTFMWVIFFSKQHTDNNNSWNHTIMDLNVFWYVGIMLVNSLKSHILSWSDRWFIFFGVPKYCNFGDIFPMSDT